MPSAEIVGEGLHSLQMIQPAALERDSQSSQQTSMILWKRSLLKKQEHDVLLLISHALSLRVCFFCFSF